MTQAVKTGAGRPNTPGRGVLPPALVFAGMALLLLPPRLHSQTPEAPPREYSSWLAQPPQAQLYAEGLDDRKGVGRIFVPVMTNPSNEPIYAVFKGDSLVGEQAMGTSFFLLPGSYAVVLGTGNLEQRIRREAEVRREETVILEPNWSALTVETIDEVRNYQKQDLQIYRVENAESFGIIPTINPELGEQLQTLILRPGLYKVFRRGDDFNTYVNFTTFILEPGTYTPMTIVVNSESGNFMGAGILNLQSQLQQRRNWKLFGAIHGSVMFTSANKATSSEIKDNLSLLAQLDNQILYDRLPHYLLSRNLLEIGALRQQGATSIINQDRLQLKNTYIYYLVKWLGGYSRFEVATHLFPTDYEFDSPDPVAFFDLNGNLVKSRFGVTRVRTAPAFFPLQLKEGLGANIAPLRSFIARLSLRAGLGFWQIYNRNVYSQDEKIDSLFRRVKDDFPRGLESSVLSNFALLRNLTITTQLDLLFPFEAHKKTLIDLENYISLGVTKNVTVEHTLRLRQDPSIAYAIQEQFITLKLSYFLF